MNKLLVPSSALLWGCNSQFGAPALALILVNLYVVQVVGSLIRTCKFHARKFWAPGPCVWG
jgi:hypothetical protein